MAGCRFYSVVYLRTINIHTAITECVLHVIHNTKTRLGCKSNHIKDGIICTKLQSDMGERCVTVPDCLLDGTLHLKRTYLKSSILGEVRFMPKDFCSADDVRSLFACDNDMTVADLLCRISNYPQEAQFEDMNPVTDSSQWKLYDVRSEYGSANVLKMFNDNFRVLDIPACMLDDGCCLMMSMRPEHTRKCAIIHKGDVTREYLAESVHLITENGAYKKGMIMNLGLTYERSLSRQYHDMLLER